MTIGCPGAQQSEAADPSPPKGIGGTSDGRPGPLSCAAGLSSRDKEIFDPWHTVIVQYNRADSRSAGPAINCSISFGRGSGVGHDMDLAGLLSAYLLDCAGNGGFEVGLGMRRVVCAWHMLSKAMKTMWWWLADSPPFFSGVANAWLTMYHTPDRIGFRGSRSSMFRFQPVG